VTSDLLVHKTLLNSVLLSLIVSGGVRPNPPPGQTPLGHNPPCLLPFVGRIESGVRVSVSFQQKYPPCSVPRCPTAAENWVMTKGVVSGGFDIRLRRITSSPSQTLRRRLVRTTDDGRRGLLDACRRLSRLYFSHFATRTVDNTVDLYAAKPDIRTESRYCLPHLHSTPPLGGSRRNIAIPFGTEKLEWLGYPTVEKIRRYLYSFHATHERDRQTNRQTDTA